TVVASGTYVVLAGGSVSYDQNTGEPLSWATAHVFDTDPNDTTPYSQDLGRIQDFVAGPGVVAFRTFEDDLCPGPCDPDGCRCSIGDGCNSVQDCDLNGDGDCCDFDLRAYDVRGHQLRESNHVSSPCASDACHPQEPYRVVFQRACRGGLKNLAPCATDQDCPNLPSCPATPSEDDPGCGFCKEVKTVRFLTDQCDEACTTDGPDYLCHDATASCVNSGTAMRRDLDGNGLSNDVVLQLFDVETARVRTAGAVHINQPPGQDNLTLDQFLDPGP